MLEDKTSKIDADKVGAFVAALCGVHCMVTPFLFLLLPALPLGEPLEWCFFTLSTLIASYASWRAYRKSGSWQIARYMGIGLTILLMPHILGWPEYTHVVMSAIGASVLIAGHVRNHRHEHTQGACTHHHPRVLTGPLGA